jgi:hypothetical protein
MDLMMRCKHSLAFAKSVIFSWEGASENHAITLRAVAKRLEALFDQPFLPVRDPCSQGLSQRLGGGVVISCSAASNG